MRVELVQSLQFCYEHFEICRKHLEFSFDRITSLDN